MVNANASVPQKQVPPSDVFFLAESYLNPTVCGHSIPISEWKVSTATTYRCPICQHPVSYILDGVAASILASIGDNKSQTTQSAAHLIYFKHGKLVFRLSVPSVGNVVSSQRGWSDWWFSFFSRNPHCASPLNTAQHRISLTLGISLQHLKILHKGKIIYPVVPPFTENSVSEYLTELSSFGDRKCSPGLLVVGTPVSQQQELVSIEKHHHHQNPPKDIWTAVRTIQVSDVVICARWMISFSIRVSLQLYTSIRDILFHAWQRIHSDQNNHTHRRID